MENFFYKDDENDFGDTKESEKSNDTEYLEQKDLAQVYEEYRQLFTEHGINVKDQQYIFKSFERKSETDKSLFMQ
jgi:hypothetical protein